MPYESPSYAKYAKYLGWAVLLLALPLALLAMGLPANKYKASGTNTFHCDGPIAIFICAVPALLLYGAGFGMNIRRWRRKFSLIVACCCFLICFGLIAKLRDAMAEAQLQVAECSTD